MERAQFLLIAILCIVSWGKFVGASKVPERHGEGRDEKDQVHKISKRYTLGRVPLSYMPRRFVDDEDLAMEKRFRSNSIRTNPAASHFRELQVRQTRRLADEDNISPAQMQSYRNLLPSYGSGNNGLNLNDMDLETAGAVDTFPAQEDSNNDEAPLTDRELKTLLLLLEGYQSPKGSSASSSSRNFYTPPAQYFTQEMMDGSGPTLGKRETGKRTLSKLGQEQPMSFENSLGDNSNYPVFLNQKRSKRIGVPPLKKSSSSVRVKKETTDPKLEASFDEMFGGGGGSETEHSEQGHHHHQSIPTTAISSSDQIPAPAANLQNSKLKKAIDWSRHFGIDKRSQDHNSHTEVKMDSMSPSAGNGDSHAINHNNEDGGSHTSNKGTNKHDDNDDGDSSSETNDDEDHSEKGSTDTVSSPPASVAKEEDGRDKLKKDKKDKSRQENDTEEKEDRKWILKEFYKNLAMSTNVKRKRESPASNLSDDKLRKLDEIEKEMEQAGDKIIWDTLKFTGAHRDKELSPEEKAQVKDEILDQLAAAYNLEKITVGLKKLREELIQLQEKQN